MIQLQNVARQTNHNLFAIETVRDPDSGEVALVLVRNPGTPVAEADVYGMTEEQAQQVEEGLRQARTGIVPASALPQGANGNGGGA